MTRIDLSLGTLRLVAVLGPITFALALGLSTDLILKPALPGVWPWVVATVVVAVGAVIFSSSIFWLFQRAHGRIEEQNRELERNARELQKLTEAEKLRAEEWKALFELGEEVTASPGMEGLLNSIVVRAKVLLDADVAALMLLSAGGREATMAAHSGLRTAGMRSLRLISEHGLQGLVLETGEPVIVDDYQSDPRLRNRPASLVKEEGLVSQIAVPFSGKGKVLGTLFVGNRRLTHFTARQAELLQTFAHWTAVVLETSRLYEQLRNLALLEERERIGMDLHDGAIQSLYAVVLRLDDCAERLSERPDEVRDGLEKAMDDLNKVIQDIRSYIFDLRPEVSHGDLVSALEDLVEGVRVNALINAELDVEGDFNGAVTEDQAASLFRIAQEALGNVSRHSQATSLRVRLTALAHSMLVEIADDGVGFDPLAERPLDRRGLRNMEERARSLGARLSLDSAPGRGTRVSVELPMDGVRQ
jgi:two-component system sensor histidine kinase DevS